MRSPLAVAAVVALSLSGCSMLTPDGDKLFEANRLEEAAEAYRDYLDKHPAMTIHGERALYRLGLIYLLPASPLHDLDQAKTTLMLLADQSTGGPYGQQASLILALQAEVSRLQRAVASETAQAEILKDELDRLEEEAAQASTVAGKHENRSRQLATEIAQLRSEIDRLSEALEQRKQELERIKEIDLGKLP